MGQLRLVRLAVVGSGAPDVSVEFGPGLTVIYGASNTGKSYVVDAIDFMLGAKSLRSIPESAAYEHVMLTMTLPDGNPITLVRKINGGHFAAYQEYLTAPPDRPADFTLNAAHGSAAGGRLSLSRYLLQAVGLDGKELRKNLFNVTTSLSFRNLCALCLIDETKMQSPVPPPLTGRPANRTAELSLIKLFLEGEDDSKFARAADSGEKRKVSKGKVEILERAISELQSSVEGMGTVLELRERIGLLTSSIDQQTSSISSGLDARSVLVTEQAAVLRKSQAYQARLGEVTELLARFGLLKAKYESDIARLEMVQEAGTLLGFFRPGVCVFCGAEVEHQAAAVHTMEEITAFGESVLAEMQKTNDLKNDLDSTIRDLQTQDARLHEALTEFNSEAEELRGQIEDMDASLQPERLALQDLISARSAIEAALSTHEQIAKLVALKATVEPEDEGEPVRPQEVSELAAAEFSTFIRQVTQVWSLPNVRDVRYSKTTGDVEVDGQPRSSHGKGMRAMLHAAFTAGLAEFCADQGREHPGFVVLDTPLRPFREPEPGVADAPSSEQIKSVTESFYSYFDTQFPGQSIVFENTDPPDTLSDDAVLVEFTGQRDSGRYGFYPPRPAPGT